MIPKKHTNELLKVLMGSGRDVNRFELNELATDYPGGAVEIRYKSSPMYFQMYPASRDDFNFYMIAFSGFTPTFNEVIRYNQSLDGVKEFFANWLETALANYIENEDEIDFWKIVKENPLTVESIDFTKDEPFGLEEREQLHIGLEEIKVLVAQKLDLTQPEISIINAKIDYLIEATRRLNKTDWKGIAISTLVAIVYDLSLDEHKRGVFLGLFKKLWAFVQHLPQHIN